MQRQFQDKEIRGLLLLKGGKVWDISKKTSYKADLLINQGKIERIGKFEETPADSEIIDISGCTVIPGLLDMHVHLREPGQEDKETISSGCAAAASGGFTSVCCMPNTSPVIDNQEVVRFIKEKSENLLVNVFPAGAVSKELKGDELAEIGFMIKAGIVAVTDDGHPVKSSSLMRKVLEYSKIFNIPVMEHAEEISLTKTGCMNEGFTSTKLGLLGMPSIAEDIIVSRDIQILGFTGGHLHIQHMSSAKSIRMIREAKDRGLNITAEATPHHFCLTDKEIESYDSNFKMNPPLRSEEDVEAVIEGLKDGTIDVIATDHAPHRIDDKEGEFDRAAFGVTGLETAVGVYFTELVEKNSFKGLEELVDLCAVKPRKILNLPLNDIQEGNEAELCIINPDETWTVKKEDFYSLAANSSFLDRD
ncbi:dihydroorotase, partial [candidate division KSB1 bacterium]